MFFKIFRPCCEDSQISSSIISSSSAKLKETREMLQEREHVLQQNISLERDRAKQFIREKNRQAAKNCLKRKMYIESKTKQLKVFQSAIRNQEQKIARLAEVAKLKRQQTLI
ncbi:vacuolar protein sorting-associated protein 32 homolog 1-like [Zingiber officinale]|uniref:vacuolar protein sorting-associated protein 32 homolog 1-like n=1 Tax=Zingiber officinale TaxID=94328 RepID=UPI001C4A88D4|nr:vacuolar protein sorting-associated protein 32 homolog 1-like [Zingiber officinale]